MTKTIKSIEELKDLSFAGKFKEVSKQRRVWSAVLSVVAVVGTVMGLGALVAVCSGLAGALGLDSYIRPSQVEKPKRKRGRPRKKK